MKETQYNETLLSNEYTEVDKYIIDEKALDLMEGGDQMITSLPDVLFRFDNRVTDGVAVTTYGRGQLSGAIYTIPAHAQISVDFNIYMQCVTPDDVATLSNLVRSMLEASKKTLYDNYSRTHVSGGASFFGFFSGRAKASYEQTKRRMESWGLSEENQRTIVNAMMNVAQKMNHFRYQGTIYNRDYDYSVSGSMFAIVMDCQIQQSEVHNQLRFLAPKPHLQSPAGETLPIVGNLY
jgi:hypothetical protein